MINLDPNTLLLFGIAVMNALGAYFAWKGKNAAIETKEIALKTEINTNSMKDALVAATREAAHAAGADEQRAAGEAKAAILAQGARQSSEPREGLVAAPDGEPVPVADDRTAVAAERGAKATERIAAAAETTAAKK